VKGILYHEPGEGVNASRVLGVFAKNPVAGQVKTRLAAASSPEWAARVAAAFLADTLDRLATVAARRFLVYTPEDAADSMADVAADRFELLPQGPGDLGERLARFFAAHMPQGAVIVVGCDSPTLPPELVEEALVSLQNRDVVIGPATDGGYYLLGCNLFIPSLFSEIDWGSSHVLRQTVQRLAGLDVSLGVLPPWYDVDSLDDWHALIGHVAALRRAGIDPGVPRTEALIQEFLS
jgi:hypothetical protein